MQQPLEHLDQVIDRWRVDALQFLREDAPKILVIVIVAVVLIWLLKAATRPLKRFKHDQIPPQRAQQLRTMAGVINGVGIFIIVFQAVLQTLKVVNIDIAPLLASAGVAGLAIGFGAQTLVKDVLNGFFILMENQYDVGDMVRVAGVQGTVEYMTLRRTVLRDVDGALHVVPNSEIHIVSNLTRDWAQITMHVSVAYSENSERVVELLKEVGREVKNDPFYGEMLVGEPEVPGIERVAAGEVDYLMLAKTRPAQQYAVKRELRRRIKETFEKNNIQPGGAARVYVMDTPPRQQG